MKIEQYIPMESLNKRNTEPFLRVGSGCDLPDCHCSEGNWISISNGSIGLLVTFEDKSEMESILRRK